MSDAGANEHDERGSGVRGDGARRTLRIGTRGSQLALWQAHTVADRLRACAGGAAVECEIVVIKTSGDRLAEAPLSEAGGKRLFVREIEEALLDGRVDLAVHSAKDMPVLAESGLTIAAVLPREEPWDAIVLPAGSRIALPPYPEPGPTASAGDPSPQPSPRERGEGAGSTSAHASGSAADSALAAWLAPLAACKTIGTSSVRRVAQLRRVLPGAAFTPIRGNLDTRLRKLDEGQYDLLVLATAGLKRLGAGERISARLPLDACVPAPGQGAIAVEVRADDEATRAIVAAIDDEPTARALAAERAVVDALGGGCQTPIGAIALPSTRGDLDLHALVISLDGHRILRARASGPAREADALGRQVAKDLLSRGAAGLLATIATGSPTPAP